ncbi:hypothetical protein [Flavobacterium sp.]|uniref:hypothetical protein n=1 Tax=Flavobacterium sp. TaxID=239 RepID=UPI0026020494|nr:hypothetical protein [Flavobacterium sp.]
MNATNFSKKIVLLTILLGSVYSYAQLSVPFKMRYQGFVKGDITVIANNSVNRVDFTNSVNEPYYNLTSYAKLNDEFEMAYIDIDEDESTFSSSSAELYLEQSSAKKIVYAGLYWSGTYKYAAGYQKSEKKFVASDPSRGSFSNVKLKLPNRDKYVDISGQVLFDGANKNEFDAFAPYAVYADITNYVKELSNPSGVFTVANVKATQGVIEGGVAAGWTIFVVYEDQNMSGKFVTSFDGFAGVTDKSTDINFTGFQTLPNGNVKAKIACAALEGDNNLIGDELLFTSNPSKIFTPLSTNIRKETNFFNSSITIENQNFSNRFPDSKNTLGYDTCLFTIPNPNNSVVENNSKEMTLRLKSNGDRCFMFFTALSVEVTPSDEEIIYASSDDKPLKIASNKNLLKFIPANKDFLIEDYKTSSSINRNKKNSYIDANNKLIEVQTASISSAESGYYIIANIFKTEQSAIEFVTFLKTKGFEADFFTNSLNNFRYVYLKKGNDLNQLVDQYVSKIDDTYEDRMQILAVNKNNNQLIADLSKKEDNTKQIASIKEPLNNQLFDVQIVSIPNEPKGYYLVANVFSITSNSTNFLNLLKSKGLNPKVLINPLNNFKYVYLKKTEDEQEAQSLYLSKLNNTYQDKLWILSVNNNNTLITNNDD